jgi:NADP-dependent aldehyde dehydrogenase
MPTGVFGMVFGGAAGGALVKASAIKAVAFTGSLNGGRALCDMAAHRPEPIPVFAEMSSINPLILLPGAVAERSKAIANGLAASVTMGSGQFCTKPGLVIGFRSEAFDRFCQQFAEAMGQKEPAVMLSQGILKNYEQGVNRLLQTTGVARLADGGDATGRAQPSVFMADADILKEPGHPLESEVFGPATVLVALNNYQELLDIVPCLNGQLTASLFAEPVELENCQPLVTALESIAGRLILNDYPTGVEVCDAMVHGGPYPATSDSRFTSVGTLAIDRFLRPVCYQGYPNAFLPDALKNDNPLKLNRLVNGKWSDGEISPAR